MHPNQFYQRLLTAMDRSDAHLAHIEAMFERVLKSQGLEIPAAEVKVSPWIGFSDRGIPSQSPSPSPEGDDTSPEGDPSR